jgi:pyrroline-5-carboxylate reductase
MAVMADPRQLYLSIMAGVRTDSIEDALGVGKIVRAMPNLPAQIGMGMSAFTCTPLVTRVELAMVQNLLNATGKTLYVENEDMLDAVTAISGSGPVYVFYMMDSLNTSAKNMGFSAAEAEMLVTTTFAGATELFVQSGPSRQEWIGRVASKGGTTEAALAAFERGQMGQKLMEGAEAARLRGVELGKV